MEEIGVVETYFDNWLVVGCLSQLVVLKKLEKQRNYHIQGSEK